MNELWAGFERPVGPQVKRLCEEKRINFADLYEIGARLTPDGRLAFAFRDAAGNVTGIKYRGPTGAKTSEPGSKYPRPLVIPGDELEWFVAEGETDGARLRGLTGGTIMVLPSGAGMFKEDWASLIPRGATVFLAYDNDEAGEKGAAKAQDIMSGLGEAVRLRPPTKDWCEWDGDANAFGRLVKEALDEERYTVDGEKVFTSWFDAACSYEEKLRNPPDPNAGVSTPFGCLPNFRPGRLYVLGGYMGDGKTTLALDFVKAAAAQGATVGFVSLEMVTEDLIDKLVSSFGVPFEQAALGRPDDGHYFGRAQAAMREMALWQGAIIGHPGATPADVDRFQKVGAFDLLVVDHLHRMDAGTDQRVGVERNVRAITNTALRHNVAVLLLAQLKRSPFQSPFPRPNMSSFRETAMIEAEAAMALFVYRKRDEFNNPTSDAELIVAKNRFGKTGVYPLHFDGSLNRFTELEPIPYMGAWAA